jgi:tetratricopeptide (TPR) repeat protein
MPARRYMVVDARRDHGFRIPRPDLSARVGAPDACEGCHADRPAGWTARAAGQWWPGLAGRPQYAEAIQAGREGHPGAEGLLSRLALAKDQPAIVRATALSLLERFVSPGSIPVIESAVGDPDPLVRFAAPDPAHALPPEERLRVLAPLLSDPVRGVRIEAARALVSARRRMNSIQVKAFEAALQEYLQAQRVNADRAEGHLNLGTLHAEMGEREAAEAEFRKALALNRWFPATYLNLADLYREKGDEAAAEATLRSGLAVDPGNAELHRAFGLALIRRRRPAEALKSLSRAAEIDSRDPRNAYTYGIALHDLGQKPKARQVLHRAHQAHPGDRDILLALVNYSQEGGDLKAARDYARALVELSPGDRLALRLLEQLESPRR